ncbi:hypothetical protein [Kordia sp.]|nr:hypothetical protein [Kordia sp.]MCH2195410.1 hypothetical protein [Kordia sp.]
MEFLTQYKATENSLEYFRAIAAFQNDEALQTLTSIYEALLNEKGKGIKI